MRYRTFFKDSVDAMLILDDGVFVDCNHAAVAMLGYDRAEEVLRLSPVNLSPEFQSDGRASAEKSEALIRRGIEEGSHRFEWEHLRKDGTVFVVEVSLTAIKERDGVQLHVVWHDITERRKMESELLRLSAAIEQSVDTVIITDIKGTIEYINPAFEVSTGYSREEALGQNPRILKSGRHGEVFYAQMWKTLANGDIWKSRMVNQRKDGFLYTEEVSISPVHDASGNVVNYVAVKCDITKELEMEAHLRQVQKMDAVGRLAGGVAHDFNNILQSILGFSGLLLDELERGTIPYNDAKEIRNAAWRAGELTRRLLLFSRKQSVEYTAQDLNEIVTRNERMMGRLLGERIRFASKLHSPLKSIRADASQVEQILLNLFVNARDAMPEGGDLVVATAMASRDEGQTASSGGHRSGEYVCLSVSDTGCGIDEAVQEHLFEPFFTTKEVEKGTGLGLSVVYGIVEQHEGWIDVSSEPGKGSVFKVYLPVHDQEVKDDPLYETHTGLPEWLGGGGESILVVEDDPVVRELMVRVLANASYRVASAADAEQALLAWDKREDGFDLLYCDVVLPDRNGVGLACEFRRRKGVFPVVLCSGYSLDPALLEQVKNKGFRFLEKPVAAVTLLGTVRKMLDKRPVE